MKFTSSQTWAIVGVTAVVWLALSVLGLTKGDDPSVVFDLADLIPAGLALAAAYERWGWRWHPLHRLGLIQTPVVIGTWRGELKTFWKDPDTGEVPPPKTVYLAIRQTGTTVQVRLLTNESASEQVAGSITTSDSGYPAISYNYRNEPELEHRRTKSPMHYGAALLRIGGKPATDLSGHYWTDRDSSGQFAFREHSIHVAQNFAEAEKLTYGPARPAGVFTYLLRP